MKKFSKILSVALLVALVLSLGITNAFAAYGATNEHDITITNNDQNVAHSYVAYQVFSGNLNDVEQVLSDIEWGSGVNGETLLAALVGTADPALLATAADIVEGKDVLGKSLSVGESVFKNCTTAQDVAMVLGTFASTNETETQSAGKIDAAATIIANNLANKAAEFAQDEDDPTVYTAHVIGDGYYFIKDTTKDADLDGENGSDSLSKYLLSVIRDTTIIAKDTGITPNKQILKDQGKEVAADSAAIGDTVTFEVTVQVPNTAKYENHFVFVMQDQLEKGLTFTGNMSVKVTKDGTDYEPAYTLSTKEMKAEGANAEPDYVVFTGAPDDPVAAPGGQAIKLVFNDFKKFAEDNDLIGKQIVITYTAVVNDDAEYKATANENEVYFEFSNNPNHDYGGDDFGPDDPKGETPKYKTRTYTTSVKVLKVDENGNALAGATFELKGDSMNRTVITGDKFEKTPYNADAEKGETIEMNGEDPVKYWKLKDGSFTTTDPTTPNLNQTQYAEPVGDVYCKVHYNFAEVSEKTVDLVLVSDANGVVEFVGLNAGDYTLEEINSPDGYNKIDGKCEFTITWKDPESETPNLPRGGFTLTQSEDSAKIFKIQWVDDEAQFVTTVQNHSGTVLPSTGGIGTTIFYVVGGVLVLAAIILLVTKKRMSE